MTKKAGRPRKAKSESRAPGVSVRLTLDERKAIDSAVLASGLPQSEWCRKSLLYIASRGIRIT